MRVVVWRICKIISLFLEFILQEMESGGIGYAQNLDFVR